MVQGGGEVDGLEGGADRHARAVGVVGVVALVPAVTAVQGDDRPGGRVDGGGPDLYVPVRRPVLGVQVLLAHPGHGGAQLGDLVLVERGVDLVAALIELLLGDGRVLLDVLLGGLDQVAELTARRAGGGHRFRHREAHTQIGLFLRVAQLADRDHPRQYVLPAGGGLGAGLRVVGVHHHARLVHGGGQERSLADVQLLHGQVVVRLGGGLDAVSAAAVVVAVQIALQDLLLAETVADLQGDHDLLELARQGLVLAEVGVLHELLRDGRPGLHLAAVSHVVKRPENALRVDARVGVEGRVLRREEVPLHIGRNLRQVHVLPVHLAHAGHL